MKIFYFIFRLVAAGVALLPFCFLYCLSDAMFFFIYYVFGYRKKITFNNLKNAFPEKSDKEIKSIRKKFYQNLADVIVEVIKTKSIKVDELMKRVQFHNYEIVEDLFQKKKSAFVSIGHCGNWEWTAIKLAMISKHKPFAVVKPLSDKFFDDYMSKLRTKSGHSNLISFKQTYRTLYKVKDELFVTIIASDQTPTKDEINYWTNFMNQDTAFFLGLEKISKSLDMAVLFFDIVRTKRGHYDVYISKITEEPKKTKQYEITESYVRKLEESIRNHPDNWLWSHRRWKHQRNEE